jgi:4,5-dihydroxyphthalate decarboxylase
MPDYPVTLACRNSDGTNAITRGRLRPPGIDLTVVEENDVVKMFGDMFKGRYDASEMSLAELIYYSTRDQCDFVGIPVFPSRLFRHSFMFCNRSSGIERPEDLNGRKIGALRWVQTAFIWLRGMLVDEYQVSPEQTRWYVSALHHWQDHGPQPEISPRDGSVIEYFTADGSDEYEVNCRALISGAVDVLMTTENRKYDVLEGESKVRRLFSDARTAEADYFKKVGFLPIMHVLVVRRSLVERHPELPEKLFEIFCQAKNIGREWIRSTPSLTMAWKNHYLEEEREIFHGDPWCYGLKANHAVLNKFLSYCYRQGISAREISPNELFAPTTWDLSE